MAHKTSYKTFSYTLSNDHHGRFISTVYGPTGAVIDCTTQHRMGEGFAQASSYCEGIINARVGA